jgi:hypothetical protein
MSDPVAPAAPLDTTPAAGRGEIPMHTTPAGEAPAMPELATLIPADYKDREYLKTIKDVPGLFKKLDESQKLIGARPAGIPQDNAKPEEIAAFNKAFGVPEKPEAYELAIPEKDAMPKEFIDKFKASFHKRGLNAKQAKGVSEDFNAIVQEMTKALGAKTEQTDADFEKLAGEVFGERKAEALKNAQELIGKYIPDQMKPHFNNLPNEQLIILASVVDKIKAEYIDEDSIPGAKGGKGKGSLEDQRAEARRLMSLPEYSDTFHPNHASVKKQVDAIYGNA